MTKINEEKSEASQESFYKVGRYINLTLEMITNPTTYVRSPSNFATTTETSHKRLDDGSDIEKFRNKKVSILARSERGIRGSIGEFVVTPLYDFPQAYFTRLESGEIIQRLQCLLLCTFYYWNTILLHGFSHMQA